MSADQQLNERWLGFGSVCSQIENDRSKIENSVPSSLAACPSHSPASPECRRQLDPVAPRLEPCPDASRLERFRVGTGEGIPRDPRRPRRLPHQSSDRLTCANENSA